MRFSLNKPQILLLLAIPYFTINAETNKHNVDNFFIAAEENTSLNINRTTSNQPTKSGLLDKVKFFWSTNQVTQSYFAKVMYYHDSACSNPNFSQHTTGSASKPFNWSGSPKTYFIDPTLLCTYAGFLDCQLGVSPRYITISSLDESSVIQSTSSCIPIDCSVGFQCLTESSPVQMPNIP